MKTFEECLDEVARNKGWKNWSEMFQDQYVGTAVYDGSIVGLIKEAALLYGEAKWNEACKEQREFCCKELKNSRTSDNLDRIKILSAPKPPFKP